jgi:hypothetical protein
MSSFREIGTWEGKKSSPRMMPDSLPLRKKLRLVNACSAYAPRLWVPWHDIIIVGDEALSLSGAR